jgi:hypothetical protein
MVRRIRSALKTLEIAILNDVKSLPEATAASRANDRLGHIARIQRRIVERRLTGASRTRPPLTLPVSSGLSYHS